VGTIPSQRGKPGKTQLKNRDGKSPLSSNRIREEKERPAKRLGENDRKSQDRLFMMLEVGQTDRTCRMRMRAAAATYLSSFYLPVTSSIRLGTAAFEQAAKGLRGGQRSRWLLQHREKWGVSLHSNTLGSNGKKIDAKLGVCTVAEHAIFANPEEGGRGEKR